MISARLQSLRSACAPISAVLCALLFAVLTMQGCGGGTTGTGGTGSSQFSGRITSIDGAPVAGASIVLEETGDMAVSDSNGNFDIESILPGDSATFLVETVEAQAATTLSDIPPGPHDVTVELKLDKHKNSVVIQSQEIAPPKKPRKTPTPRPTIASTVIAEPTATVAPTVSALPTEAPLATAVPTGIASATPDASETVVPSPIATTVPVVTPLTVFRGVATGNPQLLNAIRIGLVGSTRRVRIQSDGTFLFKAAVEAGIPQLEVTLGKVIERVPLEIVTHGAVRVILNISISLKSSGGLSLVVVSARVVD